MRRRRQRQRWRSETISRICTNCCCCGQRRVSFRDWAKTYSYESIRMCEIRRTIYFLFHFKCSLALFVSRIREWSRFARPWSDEDGDFTVSFILSVSSCLPLTILFICQMGISSTQIVRGITIMTIARLCLRLWSGFNCSFMSNLCLSA